MTRHPYHSQQIAFLTQHGKQTLLQAPLQQALGCQLLHTDAYDTDQLGTFTRDIARAGTQIDAARKKAQIGMQLLNTSIGIASEGAFGPDPYFGMSPWNTELLIWIDQQRGIEIMGWAQGAAQSDQASIRTQDELAQFCLEAGFPQHGLTLRPDNEHHPQIRKGIHDQQALQAAFAECLAESANGVAWVENDLRAHCNPTRQQMIRLAGEDLLRKLLSLCPHCASPGYWISSQRSGLPCRDCHAPTRLPLAEIWLCPACKLNDEKPQARTFADPAQCDVCNP